MWNINNIYPPGNEKTPPTTGKENHRLKSCQNWWDMFSRSQEGTYSILTKRIIGSSKSSQVKLTPDGSPFGPPLKKKNMMISTVRIQVLHLLESYFKGKPSILEGLFGFLVSSLFRRVFIWIVDKQHEVRFGVNKIPGTGYPLGD